MPGRRPQRRSGSTREWSACRTRWSASVRFPPMSRSQRTWRTRRGAIRSTPRLERGPVGALEGVDRPFPREAVEGVGPAALREGGGAQPLAVRALDRRRERPGTRPRDETGIERSQDLARPSDVGPHDGETRGERLERDEAEGLEPARREDEEVGGPVVVGERRIGDRSREAHLPLDPLLPRDLAEAALEPPRPDDQEERREPPEERRRANEVLEPHAG